VPGVLHQGILSILCDDPWLGLDLRGIARPVDGIPIDRRADLDHETDDPAKTKTRYVDVVLVVRDPADPKRGIVLCVEVQLELDEDKRWRISGYLGGLEDAHELPAILVFVSFSRRVSRAARTWGQGPGLRFDMVLLDADTVPLIDTLEAAIARPTAAVLAGALHGCRGNLDAARMGIAACQHLSPRQRRRYIATILAAVPKRARGVLMGEMTVEQRNELWEIERRSGTYLLGLENGRNEGLERGRNEGLERGRNEGLERGRRMTLVDMILTVLEVRGIVVDGDTEARVRDCESLSSLQHWARRARDVTQARELFVSG
jgi:hypothetical protein